MIYPEFIRFRYRYTNSVHRILIFLAAVMTSGSIFLQPYAAKLEITGVDPTRFPEIRVFARLRGENRGSVLTIPQDSNLFLYEDGERQELLSADVVDAGSRIMMVLDQGDGVMNTGIPLDDVRKYSLAFFQFFISSRNGFQRGRDQVMIVAQENNRSEVLSTFTGQPEHALAALENYSPGREGESHVPESGENSITLLKKALEEVSLLNSDDNSQQVEIILFTPGFMADLGGIADQARVNDIRIHVVLVREKPSEYWSLYTRKLSEETGGVFIQSAVDADTDRLLSTIRSGAKQLCLTYRSISGSTSHHLDLVLQNADISIQASKDFSINVQQPEVVIRTVTSSENLNDSMAGEVPVENGRKGDQFVVEVHVEFPDGIQQRKATASLYSEGTILNTTEVLGGTALFFLSPAEVFTSSRDTVIFYVVVQDIFGFSAASNRVTFTNPEDLSSSSGRITFWIMFILLIVLVAAGSIVFTYSRKMNGKTVKKDEVRRDELSETSTKSLNKSRAVGFLIPLEGFYGRSGKDFKLYGTTTVGRCRKYADLLIHQGEDASPISRLHCTILFQDDHFAVRDENSSNGTFLNEEPLIAFQIVRLNDGDILDLGALERGGVRVMYQSAADFQCAMDTSNESSKTKPQHELPILR